MAASRGTFDKLSFQRYMDKYGAAYRNQAMELISLCRFFSFIGAQATEDIFDRHTEMSDVLHACDEALAVLASASGKRRSTRTINLSTDYRVEYAIRRLEEYEDRIRLSTPQVAERMKRAEENDQSSVSGASSGATSRVEFRILTYITDPEPTIVEQELTGAPNLREILWNFNRYPHGSRERVTLADNPHFYEYGSFLESLNAYQGQYHRFTVNPIDNRQDASIIVVLTNKPSRIFLEFGQNSRAFDNVWNTDGIVIFKSVCGKLEGEGIVRSAIQRGPYRWRPVWPVPFEPGGWVLVQDLKEVFNHEVFEHVLHSRDVKIRIEPDPG